MAATTAGAVKALLEAQGLGISVHRDQAPDNQTLPYVSVTESVSLTPDQGGDLGDTRATRYVTELVQVDLWQHWRDPSSGAMSESYTLPSAIVAALQGASLPTAPTRVYGVTVDSVVRLLERDTNLTHHAITVRVRRAL